MDILNEVAKADDPYAVRLTRLTQGLTRADGIPLNFKVYKVIDVNAFACPDGSVRVFSSLMDIMGDDEVLGIIGHEIGHVAKHHSKKAFKQELLTGAMKDAVASAGGVADALTDSQLGALGQSLAGAKYSQKQENVPPPPPPAPRPQGKGARVARILTRGFPAALSILCYGGAAVMLSETFVSRWIPTPMGAAVGG